MGSGGRGRVIDYRAELELCLGHRLLRYLPRIVAMIEARESRLPKALRSRIAAAKAELDGAPEA
jgi:hypothetical protein